MEHLVNQPVANQGLHAEASQADDIVDLVQEIENLNKDDAIKRLLELEEQHEKTFFEIGGVLSAIKKNKWFDEFATLDEWVEKKTAVSRSSARALIQIYDAIVKSGVELAKVKHLEWTKLRAIAGVLDGENADHWIEMASSHSRAKFKTLVQERLAGSAGQRSPPARGLLRCPSRPIWWRPGRRIHRPSSLRTARAISTHADRCLSVAWRKVLPWRPIAGLNKGRIPHLGRPGTTQ